MNKIRSSVKALIIHENHLLTIEKQSGNTFKYVLPGGGQNFNETLNEAVVRECLEELGVKVKSGSLIWVREFISKHHVPDQPDNDQTHIVEHIFETAIEGEIPKKFTPSEPDRNQTGIVWIPIGDLEAYNYFPRDLIKQIQRLNNEKMAFDGYIGDIN
jgi:ADP-ribose pyrophosphatase YjhB (NUDIX family)